MRAERACGPVLASFALALVGLSCESQDCADIGCAHGVDVSAASDPPAELKAGVYRVEVVADGTTSSCDLELPTLTSCSDGPRLMANAYRKDTVSGLETLGIRVGVTPKELQVRVFRDGTLLGESQYAPSYTHTHLGGDSDDPCAQDCYYSGSHSLTLSE